MLTNVLHPLLRLPRRQKRLVPFIHAKLAMLTIGGVRFGLRPGEKLYEELLIGEDPGETRHPRIMTANAVQRS